MSEAPLDPFIKIVCDETKKKLEIAAHAPSEKEQKMAEAESAIVALSGTPPEKVFDEETLAVFKDFISRMTELGMSGASLITAPTKLIQAMEYKFPPEVLYIQKRKLFSSITIMETIPYEHPTALRQARGYLIARAYNPRLKHDDYKHDYKSDGTVGIYACEDGNLRTENGYPLSSNYRLQFGHYEFSHQANIAMNPGSIGDYSESVSVSKWVNLPLGQRLAEIYLSER